MVKSKGSGNSGPETEKSDLALLWEDVCRLTWDPLNNTTFVVFLCGVVMIGSLGVLKELLWIAFPPNGWNRPFGETFVALASIYPMLMVLSCLQLVLTSTSSKIEKDLKAVCYYISVILVIVFCFVSFLEFNNSGYGFSAVITFVCYGMSVWIWIIANGKNREMSSTPPDDLLGDTKKKPKGSYKGWNK